MQSNEIDQLATALAAAQGAFPSIPRDKTARVKTTKGYEYSYNYADLASITNALRAPLAANGLSHSQTISLSGDGMTLTTRLFHKSGQWIGTEFPLPRGLAAQELGSALTYARRYSLTALLGVATEDDDDGDAATKAQKAEKPKPTQRPTASAAPQRDMDAEYRQAMGGRIPDDPPYDEQTGEVIEAAPPPLVNAPHPKSQDAVWKGYAKKLAESATLAPDRAWLTKFQQVNAVGISAIREKSAAMHQWLAERLNEIDARFPPMNGSEPNILAAG